MSPRSVAATRSGIRLRWDIMAPRATWRKLERLANALESELSPGRVRGYERED
jgi:hypothetical protein